MKNISEFFCSVRLVELSSTKVCDPLVLPIFNTPPLRVMLPMAKLPGFFQVSSPFVSSFNPPLRASDVLSQVICSFVLSSTSCSATVNDDTDWRLSVLSSRRSSSTVTAVSLLRLRSLSSFRSVPLSVRLPPVLLKLPPSARVLFCKLSVPPLTKSPSPKVSVPPVEEIVVPVPILGVSNMVRSAVCVAKVPGGEPESVPLSLESPISSVKSVVAEPSVKVELSRSKPPRVKPWFRVTVASSPSLNVVWLSVSTLSSTTVPPK